MADVLNRTTKQLRRSVNTPDFPVIDWIINPDLAAVAGFESKYWLIAGDIVSLMSQAERDALDAAKEAAVLDSIADEINQVRSYTRAFAEVVLDEFNNLRALHGLPARTRAQLRAALRNKL